MFLNFTLLIRFPSHSIFKAGIQFFRVFGLCLLFENKPTKWLRLLYKWEKKNCSDYRVHGIQIDRLVLTVPMQKSIFKNLHRLLRYQPKCVKNRPSKPNQLNLTHFGWYLGTRCIYSKNRFLRWNRESEPVNLNTMNPIIRTIFFSRIKGSDIFLKLRAPKLKNFLLEDDLKLFPVASFSHTGCFIMNATKVFLNNFYSKAPYALKWVPYLHW